MSFDVNVLSSKPVIKAAASMQNDGGGGNLGYMGRGRKKDSRKEKQYLDNSIFNSKDDDIFGFDKDLKMPEEKSFLTKLIDKIVSLIKK